MIEISVTDEFRKRYRKLPVVLKNKAIKQEKLFRINPFHPSLHTEKIEPRGKEIWTLRVDKKYRIAYRFIETNKVVFLTVGPHDWIYQWI